MLIAMEKILLTVLAEILKEEKIFKEENIGEVEELTFFSENIKKVIK